MRTFAPGFCARTSGESDCDVVTEWPANDGIPAPCEMPSRPAGEPASSLTSIDWASAVIVPVEETMAPVPPALPTAVTVLPTFNDDELPIDAVLRFDAPLSFRSATSELTL